MLERIREGSQGVWAMGILGLVILSFIFAGVGSYINSSASVAAASVNSEEISRDELELAYQNERARMESQFGEAFAALASDSAYLLKFREGILDRLISEKLLDQAAAEIGLRVSDQQIKNAILEMREFQVDGKFNNDTYIRLLRGNGYQPNTFRDYLRVDMVRRQLSKSLIGSEFALSGEAKIAHSIQSQTRDVKYLNVSSSKFEEQVAVTDEEISAYYQSNISQFDTEQKVSLAYVELKLEDLVPTIQVTDEELREHYEQNLNAYRTDEERKASHILFEASEEDEAVQAKAEGILEQIKSGEDFAELAKANSSDTFSAENGGDLGWFGKGIMDPAFEEAAFALTNTGDVSAVIKSEFGYHIIKLTDVKPEQVTAFEELRSEIESQVKNIKAEEEFYTLQQRISEVAFEVPDNLDEVAELANKPVSTTALFARNEAPQEVINPKVLASAFSTELIDDAVNSEVLELGNNHIMVLRVVDHEAERTKTQDEVKDEINVILVAEASQQAAREWASEVKGLIEAEEDVATKLDALGVTWEEKSAITRNEAVVSQSIVDALFKMSEGGVDVVDLITGDVSLVQLTKVNPVTEADNKQVESLKNRLAATESQILYGAVIESLKAQADIEIYQ